MDVSELPSGTVSFLFTDIEGSTGHWDAQPDAMRLALARHDELLRGAIGDHGGHVFATGGDGYAVAFARARDALQAGVEVQKRLAQEPWPEGAAISVRMGIHTGEADERDGDYFGPAVNRAARIMGVANGGQLIISALTAGLVDLPGEIEMLDLGAVMLKGVEEPVEVFGVAAEGLEWVDRPLASAQSTVGNLPRLQTEFVGSLANLQRRADDLPQTPLATLTGSGGVGKTRVAIEVGWLVVDEFADGVWLTELGAVAEQDAVASVVASILGVQGQPGVPLVDSIVDWCLDRRMLLILDNCEHVLDPIADLVGRILSGCPTVSILATSREPLGVPGEQVIRVPSLSAENSVELFCDRARAADGSFDPSQTDLDAIAAVCTRLDGIPLAIELAAARTRSLSPSELLERLHDRFRLLRGGGRGALERQQTLRATVTWSYQLLHPDERLLFDRISVFAGAFDLHAAEEVCADEQLDEFDVLDLIGGLVDKSMLVAERTEAGTRYRQLETLRQFGEDRLDERGETAQIRDRHLRHYRAASGSLAERWFSPDQAIVEVEIAEAWNNLRAAHSWAIVAEELDAAVDILWNVGPYASENLVHDHRYWAQRTLELGDDLEVGSAVAASGASLWAVVDGDVERARDLARDKADVDDPDMGSSACLAALLITVGALGRAAECIPIEREIRRRLATEQSPAVELYMRQALALMSSDRAGDALSLEAFGERTGTPMALMRGATSRGLACLSESPPDTRTALVHFDRAQDFEWAPGTWARHITDSARASALALAGDERAAEAVRGALLTTYDKRNWLTVHLVLDVAVLQLLDADPRAAATMLGYLAGHPATSAGAYQAIRAQTLAAVAEMPYGEEWMSHGARMGRHDVVKYALDRLDQAAGARPVP